MTEDTWRRRWWVIVAGAIGCALLAGTAVGVVTSRDDSRPSALIPAVPTEDPVSEAPPTTEAPTPSASASPSPTRTPSPTPSPTPTHTPSPTPSPTPSKPRPTTPSPTPTKRTDVAYVRVENTFSGTVEVHANDLTWTITGGGSATGEVVPRPDLNDGISVGSVDHPTCGMGDSDHYFEAGKTYRLVIVTSKNACTVDGKSYDAPFFELKPA